ncbi:MAG TPA: sulfotransferase [Stellaceae bacterium]|nr:sulfotransferase [Stellaceae bacterium]
MNNVAESVGLFGGPLSTRDLIRSAQANTGLTDFGEWDIEEPLDILISSYEAEANLNPFGRMAARWDLLRFLSNLLKFRQAEIANPEILDEKVEQPIFITGMPRSGTSFLHELLCEDPSNWAVRCWETIYPFAMTRRVTEDTDRRRRKVDRQLASFTWIAPEIASLHPITADSPQECTEITGHIFRSMRFDTTHYVPTYRHWLDSQSQLAPYRFHRRFLQHLQHGRKGGRWILKSPDHVFALDALREVYPDARFVFMHRPPLAVMPSLARLTEALRQPFTKRLDRRQIGTDLAERWRQGTAIIASATESLERSPEPPLHFQFQEFVRDPAGAVETLYAHFGLPLADETTAAVRDLVARKPTGGNGLNHGRLEDYGLDPQSERRRFSHYLTFLNLEA